MRDAYIRSWGGGGVAYIRSEVIVGRTFLFTGR